MKRAAAAILGGGATIAVAMSQACGPSDTVGCDQATTLGAHTTYVDQVEGGCDIGCAAGWLDCDHNAANGCETQGTVCPDASSLVGTTTQLLALLDGAPHGIAACSSSLLFLDDMALVVLTTGDGGALTETARHATGAPAGGLACDGTSAYWATQSDADGGPGSVWQLALATGIVTRLTADVSPDPGIDVGASSVYWMARGADGGALAVSAVDGGWAPVMPATETGVYKPFALLPSGAFALATGAIWFDPADGAAPSPMAWDAGAAVALLPADASSPYALITSNGDSGTQTLIVDLASSATVASALPPVVASATRGNIVVLGSDDSVYAIDLSTQKSEKVAGPLLHVSDVAVDATHAYWLTKGEGLTPGGVWSAPLP